MRDSPKTEKVDPRRMKLRRDNDDPKWKKSNTDSADPKLA
jgi:hypothetical protein